MKAVVKKAGDDLFLSRQSALVCPVNTKGYMGALAGVFQQKYPKECQEYQKACAEGRFTVGDLVITPILQPTTTTNSGLQVNQGLRSPRWIIFFPTVVEPGQPSSMWIILMGLQNMIPILRQIDINSIALPALGCGVGGLQFDQVLQTVNRVLEPEPWLSVEIYPPHER